LLLSPAETACWLSHHRCLETFISRNQSEYCLVLEDDALLSKEENWRSFLDKAIEVMKAHDIQILQLGFLSSRYRFRLSPSYFFEQYLLLRQRYRNVATQIGPVVLHEFRVGAHAYLVSREGAKQLSSLNIPVAFPTDGFLAHLAETQDPRGFIRFARVKHSLVEQVSRRRNLQVESDISG
jgi:GR25 family glycosyltransferase involved in LPS biosynthesis